jgi:hypothetical protein
VGTAGCEVEIAGSEPIAGVEAVTASGCIVKFVFAMARFIGKTYSFYTFAIKLLLVYLVA